MTQQQNQDSSLLREITLRNVLSYGPQSSSISLGSLNVLIGPNGSGKSNLIEAVALLRATPADMRTAISNSGGVSEWIWKGNPKAEASIDAVCSRPSGKPHLRHVVSFQAENQFFHLTNERIEDEHYPIEENSNFYFGSIKKQPVLLNAGEQKRRLIRASLEPDKSILEQRRDPDTYPELSDLAKVYEKVRIYR
ncbi:MAG: AAA family ATPase, partial [Blastocatellia bacterium]